MEAQGLKEAKGGFEIHGATDFNELMDKFCTDYGFWTRRERKLGIMSGTMPELWIKS